MTRSNAASALAGLAAVLYLATAALHHTGYTTVRDLSRDAGADLAVVAPLLWVFFSINLMLLGLAAAAIAWRPAAEHRLVLVCVAAVPAAAALLQIVYLEFSPPTAILLLDAAVALAAGLALPPRVQPA